MTDIRYPMRRKLKPSFVSSEDVEVRFDPPKVGRAAATMIVSEEVLSQIGARAVEAAVDEMGKVAVYAHQGEIETAVRHVLHDHDWIKPIIENELRRATRDFVLSLWSDDEKKNLRDWFDIFTAKCLGE